MNPLDWLNPLKSHSSRLHEIIGITEASLYKWRSQYAQKQDQTFKNEPSLDADQQELKRLRLELMQVKDNRFAIVM